MKTCSKKEELYSESVTFCESSSEPLCTGTDGGNKLNTRGNTITKEDSTQAQYTDVCIRGNRIVEQYCVGDSKVQKLFSCPGECVGGACV